MTSRARWNYMTRLVGGKNSIANKETKIPYHDRRVVERFCELLHEPHFRRFESGKAGN